MQQPQDLSRFWSRAHIFRWPCLVIYVGALVTLVTLSFLYGEDTYLLVTESVFDYLGSEVFIAFIADQGDYYSGMVHAGDSGGAHY
jgi:hypothetical protein